MRKYKFKQNERYAVWLNHDKRCWLCTEPLRLLETTIDHILPESLLNDLSEKARIFKIFGLKEEFNINGFENWLPAHSHCNQKKGTSAIEHVMLTSLILAETISKAAKVLRTSQVILENISKDKLLAKLAVALEKNQLTKYELENLLENDRFIGDPEDVMIKLDNGYWIHSWDIAYEGYCECERLNCVDSKGKVYCYFNRAMSPWVINSRLYWKCYDEIIKCPHCHKEHKRGHIGRSDYCSIPLEN